MGLKGCDVNRAGRKEEIQVPGECDAVAGPRSAHREFNGEIRLQGRAGLFQQLGQGR